MATPDDLPRYAPARDLPPYRYVPGQAPHPTRDPAGHSYGREEPARPALDPERWREVEDYLYGVDLFNRGYYWEAHEAWEGLWHAAGREGATADFLKALIALAAAGVKAREGMSRGAAAHGRRAADLLAAVAAERPEFMGLDVEALHREARTIERDPPAGGGSTVFRFALLPG